MDISKLVPNIEELMVRYNAKQRGDKLRYIDTEDQISSLLAAVAEYKRWNLLEANYPKDSTLQNLPIEYYQICAKQNLTAYEQMVQAGIPILIQMGILDKNGNLP